MDGQRFDDLTRTLATPVRRRAVATALAGGALAALLGGHAQEATAKKRKRRKRKKPAGCSRSCFNKACGQDDGCGTPCTVQQGCDQDEACVDGACVPNVCNPACTGNHVCQPDGNCGCPPGLKECAGPGYFGNCHECCNANNSSPSPECEGNPNGQYCADYVGELVFRCQCPGANCGGLCGICCNDETCVDIYGPGHECVNRACRCKEGLSPCGPPKGCRNISTDRDACGSICKVCPSEFPDCVNGACCTNDCGPSRLGFPCCFGTCSIIGGTPQEPQYGCA